MKTVAASLSTSADLLKNPFYFLLPYNIFRIKINPYLLKTNHFIFQDSHLYDKRKAATLKFELNNSKKNFTNPQW